MKKILLAIVAAIMLLPFTFGIPINVTEDLKQTIFLDLSSVPVVVPITTVALDSNHNKVYFGTQCTNGQKCFGVYDIAANSSLDLTSSAPFLQDDDILGKMVYDGSNRIYFIAVRTFYSEGLFAYYDIAKNASVQIDVSLIFPFGVNTPLDIAYDSKNDGVYIVGSSVGGAVTFRFAYYSNASNSTTDLTDKIDFLDNFFGGGDFVSVDYDSVNDGAYVVTTGGTFWFYDKATNTTTNLNSADTTGKLNRTQIMVIPVADKNGNAYLSSSSSLLFESANFILLYYNKSNNSIQDISSNIPSNLQGDFSNRVFLDIKYIKNNDILIFGGDGGRGWALGYGQNDKLFLYVPYQNATRDLSDTDAGNFRSSIWSFDYDASTNRIYAGGYDDNRFGDFSVYQAFTLPTPSSVQSTPNGTNVTLNYANVSLGNNVSITFDSVTSQGQTTVLASNQSSSPPSGFKANGTFYDLSTTATFSGPITISLPYDPATVTDPAAVRMFHFENNTWTDVTIGFNSTLHVIIGQVNSLSPFVLGTPLLTSLSPAKVWIGVRNSDDMGTNFDLKAEVFKNGTLIGAGEIFNVSGGSSGFNNAKLRIIPLNLASEIPISKNFNLSIALYARIAANSGHISGTARLWFNDAQANSSFDAAIGGVNKNFYLVNVSSLSTNVGTGLKKTADVSVSKIPSNPYKLFGTWSKVVT